MTASVIAPSLGLACRPAGENCEHMIGEPAHRLPVDEGVVDLGLRRIGLGLLRVDDGPDRRVVHLFWKRPPESARLRSLDDRPHRRRGTPARERDVPDAYPHGLLPEDLSVLDRFLLLFPRWTKALFAPIGILREKEVPLAGRVAVVSVIACQSIVERCSSAAWSGAAKAVQSSPRPLINQLRSCGGAYSLARLETWR